MAFLKLSTQPVDRGAHLTRLRGNKERPILAFCQGYAEQGDIVVGFASLLAQSQVVDAMDPGLQVNIGQHPVAQERHTRGQAGRAVLFMEVTIQSVGVQQQGVVLFQFHAAFLVGSVRQETQGHIPLYGQAVDVLVPCAVQQGRFMAGVAVHQDAVFRVQQATE